MSTPKHECYIVKVAEGKDGSEGFPSVGPSYESVFAKETPPGPEDIHTCWDIFSMSVKQHPSNDLLGRRKIVDGKAGEYVFDTYQQVYDKVIAIGSAMRTVGVQPGGGRCGIYGANAPEWMISLEACNSHGILCVPLYDSLGENAVNYIVNHAEVSVVFVQEAKIPLLLKSLSNHNDYVKTVVSFGTLTSEQKTSIEGSGMTAYSWDDFMEFGRQNPVELSPPTGEDICTIMYTSGTTGDPKGVLISNESIVDVVVKTASCMFIIDIEFTKKDSLFSFLPLAHIFDRAAEELMIHTGAKIGYWQGDPLLLMEDVKALQPTLFLGVPRIFDRVHTGFFQKVNSSGWLQKLIVNFGYKIKLRNMRNGVPFDKASPIFDWLVFNKVKEGFGGHLRCVLSGAAPLGEELEEFLRVALCAPVLQGYGLTETCAGTFLGLPDVMGMLGTVGPPMPYVQARLESIPEMNYDALGTPARGEICVKGLAVFNGYYKQDELTNEVLVDGWFHTGDVGEWQPGGAMKIIDRKKNIFKLSQGEYVAVEKLENVYSVSSVVDMIWVYGNSFEQSLVAVVVPVQASLESWAKGNGVDGDFKALCQNPKAGEYVLKELAATQKNSKLKGYEAIKAVYLEPKTFGFENDLISPTLKKKRAQLLQHYKGVIDSLYKSVKSKK